jgi:hypothetical protein
MSNLKEASVETLQRYIIEGKKILLKKPEKKQFIQIRFNLNDVDGTRKWRVIVDGIEFHTKEVFINCQSRTESEYYPELQGYKHHIVIDSNQVEFINNTANIS